MKSSRQPSLSAHLIILLNVTLLAVLLAASLACSPANNSSQSDPSQTGTDPTPKRTQVAVLGMIHDQHRTSPTWGLDQVRSTIVQFAPTVVCAEIPPSHWPRTLSDWNERQVVEDPRVKRFPEYTDVLLPLMGEMGFEVVPCAGWTQKMAEERNQRIKLFETDPEQADRYAEYQRRNAGIEEQHAASPIDEDDPHIIHSDAYDARTKEELKPYDEMLNDWIGAGGWTNINKSHYALIDKTIKEHPGERILITFGAGHKYWFLEQLRQRSDIELVDINPFLPSVGSPASSE